MSKAPWIDPALASMLAQLKDEAIVSLTLFGEARSEPIEGIVAVGNVITNRLRDPKQRWGTTYRDVCLQPWQFSCWNVAGGERNYARVTAMARALLEKSPDSKHPSIEQCAWAGLGITWQKLADNTKGANHYHGIKMIPRPSWAQQAIPVKQVAGHVFYAL